MTWAITSSPGSAMVAGWSQNPEVENEPWLFSVGCGHLSHQSKHHSNFLHFHKVIRGLHHTDCFHLNPKSARPTVACSLPHLGQDLKNKRKGVIFISLMQPVHSCCGKATCTFHYFHFLFSTAGLMWLFGELMRRCCYQADRCHINFFFQNVIKMLFPLLLFLFRA